MLAGLLCGPDGPAESVKRLPSLLRHSRESGKPPRWERLKGQSPFSRSGGHSHRVLRSVLPFHDLRNKRNRAPAHSEELVERMTAGRRCCSFSER